MKTGNFCSACFMATWVKEKVYPKGNKMNQYIELELSGNFEEYPPLQKLIITRGERKGKVILKLQTWDYTNEHRNRKVNWKLAGRKGHLSKVFQIASDKAWVDFKTLGSPDDIGLIHFDECLEYGKVKSMKVFIIKDARNDPGIIQMFKDQAFS